MSDRTKMDKYCNILLETAHTNAGQQSAKSLVVVNFVRPRSAFVFSPRGVGPQLG